MDFDHTKAFEEDIAPILVELTKALIKHKINGMIHIDLAYSSGELHCFSQTWETNEANMTEILDVLDLITNDEECFTAASKAIEEIPAPDGQPTEYLH